jgi:predicted TIM-barrel fold metal-dependent hydrolase
MKIIDFHTHFFPNKLLDALWRWFETHAWPIEYKNYADEMVAILKKEGVSRCVSLHYPHKTGMAESLNEYAFRLSEKYQNFIIPFGSVHPDDDKKETILKKCFEDYAFKGLKFHCHVQKMAPDDRRMDFIYRMSEEYDRIVLIHCGTGPHFKDRPTNGYGYDVTKISGVKRFEKVIRKYPRLTFVVPHLGFEEMEEFVALLNDYPNLYLDTTMVLSRYFPHPLRREWLADHADRLIFGTDFPNIPYEWKREKEGLKQWRLGPERESKIFFENAARLLRIAGNDS